MNFFLADDDVVIVIYPHTARDDDELNLKVNDEITVIEQGESGWWRGHLGDKEGLFPSSCVLKQHKDEKYRSVSRKHVVIVTDHGQTGR